MTREELEGLDRTTLIQMARRHRILGAEVLEREELIDRVWVAENHGRATRAAGSPRAGSAQQQVGPAEGTAAATPELATLTLARLYLSQDKPARALEVLEEVVARDGASPDADALRAKIQGALVQPDTPSEVAPRVPPPPAPPPAPPPGPSEPLGMLDLEEPPDHYDVDEVMVLARDPWSVFVWYEATEGGKAAARAALAESDAGDCELTLRVMYTWSDPEGRLATEVNDQPVDWNHGRRYCTTTHAGARVQAAVGLRGRRSGRFVSISHSPEILVPRHTPSPYGPVEWMEVEPDHTRGLTRSRPRIVVRRGAAPDPSRIVWPGEEELIPAGPTSMGAVVRRPGGERELARPSSPWRWRQGS